MRIKLHYRIEYKYTRSFFKLARVTSFVKNEIERNPTFFSITECNRFFLAFVKKKTYDHFALCDFFLFKSYGFVFCTYERSIHIICANLLN